jgi:uncharacterized protein YgiM (DUF1202 family)
MHYALFIAENHLMTRLALLILLVLASVAKPVFADACLHAPAPRLSAGIDAVISRGAGRLNLRALPALDTGINVQLYAGNRVTVLGGPSCNGLYNWWRVETQNGARGWVAEGTWEAYFVIPFEEYEAPPTPFEWACLRAFDPLYCL